MIKQLYIGIALIGSITMMPYSVGAYSIAHGEDLVRIENPTNENLYAAWGNIESLATISGDAIMAGWGIKMLSEIKDNSILAGWNIESKGIVHGDLMVLGGNIRISAPVYGDIRGAGWNIVLESTASGDVNLAAWEVYINKEASIGKDLSIAGDKINIHGNVYRNVAIIGNDVTINSTIYGDLDIRIQDKNNLHIWPSAKVMWKINYRSNESIPEMDTLATQWTSYLGKVEFDEKKYDKQITIKFIEWYIVYRLLFLLIVWSIILGIFRKNIENLTHTLSSHPGKSFLSGLLYFIVTPILAILLFITVIGIPFWVLTLAIYMLSFLFAKLIAVVVTTSFINTTWGNTINTPWKKWGIFIFIATLFAILNGIDIIFVLFAIGAIVLHTMKLFENRNK